MRLKDLDFKSPGLVQMSYNLHYFTFSDLPVEAPLRTVLTIGDGSLGQCGETVFSPSDCEVGANVVTCEL